jgi:L-fuculose-phosphate aldolase
MSGAANWLHPRDEILRTIERIYRYRMTTTSGGNLSIRDDDGDIWITPARLDKGSLRREDIVCVREGTTPQPRPSSELPFHRAIYAARPDLNGIVHAHPVALVAFSICGKTPDTRVLYQASQICREIGFAPYALPGSEALGANIAETFARGFNCVILENHGVVVGGETLQQAFERFETLEFTAKTSIKANWLGNVRNLTEEQLATSRPMPLEGYARPRPRATSHEKELRRQLVEFVQRAYRQRLMISTEGAFSARVSEHSFLITRHRADRSSVDLDDIILVHQGAPQPDRIPSRSAANHLAIYNRHPEIQAIVNAYPVNATAFAITEAPLDSRTIPESYIFLRDVQRAPFGVQFGDGKELAERTSLAQPVLLLENDGVQVVGTSVLDAFDRLEVLETTAEAMINSRPLGPLAPMSDAVITELRQAFGMD